MKRWVGLGLLLVLSVVMSSCGGGGGGGDVLSVYEQRHLNGTWSYTCTREDGAASFSGQMTIDAAGNIVGLTNSLCTQVASGYMYVTTNLEYGGAGPQLRLLHRHRRPDEVRLGLREHRAPHRHHGSSPRQFLYPLCHGDA